MRSYKVIFVFTVLAAAINACPDDPYCIFCSSVNAPRCDFCENSFRNHETNSCDTRISKVVENCWRYKGQQGETTCAFCNYGYVLIDDVCIKCTDENCALCNQNQSCRACYHGMKTIQDEHDPLRYICSDKEKCSLDNCNLCSNEPYGQEICFRCLSGFTVLNDKCIPQEIEGCEQLESKNPKSCNICANGYYVSGNGTCVKRDSGSSPFIKILLTLLILAALGAAGYFAYVHFYKNRHEAESVYMTA